mmetsp:Transcript_9310/g.17600  ORF Transcript_9310/g.17600 Transcript_9310/m.17600 type:complete len:164 (+) Transcript_9310:6504-6995(+)
MTSDLVRTLDGFVEMGAHWLVAPASSLALSSMGTSLALECVPKPTLSGMTSDLVRTLDGFLEMGDLFKPLKSKSVSVLALDERADSLFTQLRTVLTLDVAPLRGVLCFVRHFKKRSVHTYDLLILMSNLPNVNKAIVCRAPKLNMIVNPGNEAITMPATIIGS